MSMHMRELAMQGVEVTPAVVREEVALRCGPGKAKQEMKKECDINNIVDRFKKTGQLSHLAKTMPVYADVSEMGDLATVIDRVRSAEAFFAALPSSVRTEFRNRPEVFLDALGTPQGQARLKELGLLDSEQPPRAAALAGTAAAPPVTGGAAPTQ